MRPVVLCVVVLAGVAVGGILACDGPGNPQWPNEPKGYRLVSDYDMHALNDGGWLNAYPASIDAGDLSVIDDATAPLSPSAVWQFTYPAGFVDGSAPATVYYGGLNARALYVGFWWKASNPWQDHPATNKIAFLNVGPSIFVGMHNNTIQVQDYVGSAIDYDPNVTTTPLTSGTWHRIEWWSRASDGSLKVWVDGVLNISLTGVAFPATFTEFQFSPTWGGNVGLVKTQTDHFWYDHVHLSVP